MSVVNDKGLRRKQQKLDLINDCLDFSKPRIPFEDMNEGQKEKRLNRLASGIKYFDFIDKCECVVDRPISQWRQYVESGFDAIIDYRGAKFLIWFE